MASSSKESPLTSWTVSTSYAPNCTVKMWVAIAMPAVSAMCGYRLSALSVRTTPGATAPCSAARPPGGGDCYSLTRLVLSENCASRKTTNSAGFTGQMPISQTT
ncbi:hypothetical protein GCM10010495_32220 [Kitasatospora herbaricolor]|nr:hypothetical protein GCM10010495_32220 [Kitasatospora herbaricolor]